MYRAFLAGLLFLVVTSSLLNIYEKRSLIQSKIFSLFGEREYSAKITETPGKYALVTGLSIEEEKQLVEKILDGNLILYFRHAEREKWIDVPMYDALEANRNILAENSYFRDAVCLSSRGQVQARAMGEALENLNLNISQVVSSPSCRARQTATIAFGPIDLIDHVYMHRGPYVEELDHHLKEIKESLQKIRVQKDKNVIISAHNGVMHERVFDDMKIPFDDDIEEGGFYVISNDKGTITLVGYFNNFQHFHRHFETRNKISVN